MMIVNKFLDKRLDTSLPLNNAKLKNVLYSKKGTYCTRLYSNERVANIFLEEKNLLKENKRL